MYVKAVRYIEFMHDSRLLWLKIKLDKAKEEYDDAVKNYEQSKKELFEVGKGCVIAILVVFAYILFTS